ncbi:Fe2+-dependent dioxygenase [Parashewanella spongiae]|nr:Fe2+-dependent dioxygenase [Parashewanella spongiae]MCL1079082.1 Fe2+-dependent dioxygenase [Parashewanella spongiae]
MITPIPKLLNTVQIQALRNLIKQGEFEDGKKTAGWHAKDVKRNRQWQASDEIKQQLNEHLTQTLSSCAEFTARTYAKNLMPFIVSLSTQGGGYGDHIDDALMHHEHLVRTDISCTVFLSDPNEYDGGELVMTLGGVEMSYKLNAGDVIIYPSTTLHRVNPVTSGSRLVALTWIESLVSGADKREMLYDLDCARKGIMGQQGKTSEFDLITKTHANLLRRWATT